MTIDTASSTMNWINRHTPLLSAEPAKKSQMKKNHDNSSKDDGCEKLTINSKYYWNLQDHSSTSSCSCYQENQEDNDCKEALDNLGTSYVPFSPHECCDEFCHTSNDQDLNISNESPNTAEKEFVLSSRYSIKDPSSCSSSKNNMVCCTAIRRQKSSMKGFSRRIIPRRRARMGDDSRVAETKSHDKNDQDEDKNIVERYLPGRMDPIKHIPSISFKEEVALYPVDPVKTLSDSPELLWYQEDEYYLIQLKAVALVDHVGPDGVRNGKKYCLRGLEHWKTPQDTQTRKNQAWQTVLQEQCTQRKFGYFNDEHIAALYKFASIPSQVAASKRAYQDAQDSIAYLQESH